MALTDGHAVIKPGKVVQPCKCTWQAGSTCGTAWPTPPRPKNFFTACSCSGVEGRGRFASVRITLHSVALMQVSLS